MSEDRQKLLLTPLEAAQALSISPRSLWTLTQSGRIRSVRIGRQVRYPVDALNEFIDQCPPGNADSAAFKPRVLPDEQDAGKLTA
jgi:excisionase family DNA binding protein